MAIALALSITLAIELLVIFIFFHKDIRTFLIISLANAVLNVSMNLLILLMPNDVAYFIFLISYELFTFAIETLILIFVCKKPRLVSFIAALLANILSLGVGLIINQFSIDTKTTIVLIVVFSTIYSLTLLADIFLYYLNKN